jgi:thiol-disulfide isomerase/thioredoxin
MKLITTTTLTWGMQAEVPETLFQISLPERARKVDDIYAALVRGTPADLLGRPAPKLELKRAGEGKPITLEAHRGKDVVVLDFWATWCGVCVKSMPRIAKLAETYQGKDVVFYAVNVGEEPAEVERFLRSSNLTFPTALDPDSEATERFGITAIPALLIIGKDGTVQAEYSGAGPELEESLSRDIDALLEGKTLVP